MLQVHVDVRDRSTLSDTHSDVLDAFQTFDLWEVDAFSDWQDGSDEFGPACQFRRRESIVSDGLESPRNTLIFC